MTMISRGGGVPEDGRPETADAAFRSTLQADTGLRDEVLVEHDRADWALEFAPADDEDEEYVGDEPEKKEPGPVPEDAPSLDGEWLLEVSVTAPDGRRVTSEAWFPKPTMSPRTVGEYLIAAAENVRNRVNTLP